MDWKGHTEANTWFWGVHEDVFVFGREGLRIGAD